jgi:hypothetical protein
MLFLAAVSPSPTTREAGAKYVALPCGHQEARTGMAVGATVVAAQGRWCCCNNLLHRNSVEERLHVVRGGSAPTSARGSAADDLSILLLLLLLLFVPQLLLLPSAAAGVVVPCPPVARFTLKGAPLAPLPPHQRLSTTAARPFTTRRAVAPHRSQEEHWSHKRMVIAARELQQQAKS